MPLPFVSSVRKKKSQNSLAILTFPSKHPKTFAPFIFLYNTLNDFSNDENMAAGLRTLSNLGSNILNVISQNLKNYQDGISETSLVRISHF